MLGGGLGQRLPARTRGRAGEVTRHILSRRSTDAGFARSEPLEGRLLFAATTAVGAPAGELQQFTAASDSIEVHDGDGTVLTFALAGPGSGNVVRDDGGFVRLTLSGTTAASTLTIKTDTGGDGRAALGDVEVDGSLRAFTGRTADLHGSLTATGSLRSVTLNSANDPDGTITAPSLGSLS